MTTGRLRDEAIIKMAYRCGQAVSSIQILGKLFNVQHTLQQLGDLLLGCISIACDGLLNFSGGIFIYGQGTMQGG